MIKKKRDIRKIKVLLGTRGSANTRRFGGPSVRLIQLLEKSRIMKGIVNKHFHTHNLLSQAGMKAFFSNSAAKEQLSRIYENFYQQKLESERYYYKSKPTMTYKMLKSFFDYNYHKDTELIYRKAPPPAPAVNQPPVNYDMRESESIVRVIESGRAYHLTGGDLKMITQSVLDALTKQRLMEERRKGR